MICRSDGRSENGCYRVVPGRDDGWEVVVERAPGIMSSTYCSDWHRVERVCAALDQLLTQHTLGGRADRV